MEWYKSCPYCDNRIKEEAVKCQYCHEFLDKNIENNELKTNSFNGQKYKKLSKFWLVGCVLLIISFLSLLISSFFSWYSRANVFGIVINEFVYILIVFFILVWILKHNRIFWISLIVFSWYNLLITLLKRIYWTLNRTPITTMRIVWKSLIFIISVIWVVYVFKYNSALKNIRLSKKEKISIIFLILLFIYLISEIVYHFVNYY